MCEIHYQADLSESLYEQINRMLGLLLVSLQKQSSSGPFFNLGPALTWVSRPDVFVQLDCLKQLSVQAEQIFVVFKSFPTRQTVSRQGARQLRATIRGPLQPIAFARIPYDSESILEALDTRSQEEDARCNHSGTWFEFEHHQIIKPYQCATNVCVCVCVFVGWRHLKHIPAPCTSYTHAHTPICCSQWGNGHRFAGKSNKTRKRRACWRLPCGLLF